MGLKDDDQYEPDEHSEDRIIEKKEDEEEDWAYRLVLARVYWYFCVLKTLFSYPERDPFCVVGAACLC